MSRTAGQIVARMLLLATLLLAALPAGAAPAPTRTLVPIGSGYEPPTLERFARAAAEHDTTGNVELLVIPSTFGLSATSTTNSERRKNLDLAETRRGQVEAACNVVRKPTQTCRAILVPMLIRPDAYDPANLARFTPDVDGMYILGGDQTVAMGVLAETPAEQLMAGLYAAGAVVGGNSAGAAVESLTMIAGYTGNNGPENGFQQGSVDIWAPEGAGDLTRGLSFGIQSVVLDQHVLQRGRIGRLINTAFATGLPGVGADADTAATIVDEASITDVAGRSAAFVVDLDTYGASGRYGGPTSSLAIRGATTHLIPAGGFGYSLAQRRPTVGGQANGAPSLAGRGFGALRAPTGAGALLLGGGLSGDLGGQAAQRFVALSAAQPSPRIVVLTVGYPKAADGRAAAKAIAAALQTATTAPVQAFALDSKPAGAAAALADATGIWISAPDASLVMGALAANGTVRDTVLARWHAGTVLLADDAAAAALGSRVAANTPMPTATSDLEEAAILSFRPDGVSVQPGLGVLQGVAIEPRFVFERRWGRLYNLLNAGAPLGLGIDTGTAVELTASAATAVGTSVAVTLDGRAASFGVGENGALSARYVALDSFVDGDAVAP